MTKQIFETKLRSKNLGNRDHQKSFTFTILRAVCGRIGLENAQSRSQTELRRYSK